MLTLGVENWKEAQSDFFESFRNYDEAGSLRRIQVLKYLVLTSMLMKSEINPFDSQETKPYRNDPRIVGMTDLVEAYQRNEIHRYEQILETHKAEILSDPFIREHIDEVTRNVRTEALTKLIKPYTRFTLSFIAEQLQIPVHEAQDILGFLILEGKVKAKINAADGSVTVTPHPDAQRIASMDAWATQLDKLAKTVLATDDVQQKNADIFGVMDHTGGQFGDSGGYQNYPDRRGNRNRGYKMKGREVSALGS